MKSELIGEKIGELTVIDELEPHITPNGSKQRIVLVRCSCGNEYVVRLTAARKTKKCRKCAAKERRVDLTGQRFGRLLVTSMADDYISPQGHRLSRCNCVCDCGNKCVVNMSELISGGTLSCGCLKRTRGLLKDNQKLMRKYDYERNMQLGINLETQSVASNKKIWWKCAKCGNSWYATIASQSDPHKDHGCPYCSRRLPIVGKTDFASQHPELLSEWNYERNDIAPTEVTAYSSKKVWWKCNEGHEWKATIANRVNGSGCPRCNIENVNSFCEQSVYYYVKKAFPDAINGDSHIGMELDVYIPSINVGIEYDGEAWHRSSKKEIIDIRKNNLCLKEKITLIRIREPKLKLLDNCICISRLDSTSHDSLDKVIMDVLNWLGIKDYDVDTERDTGAILDQFSVKKYENSLAYNYPAVAAEWHPYKNGGLTPDKVNKASRFKVWWKGSCGHEWQMVVADRTRAYKDKNGKIHKPQGCPYCAGKKILVGYNDLNSQRPEIASMWHPTKNGSLKPTDVMVGSSKKVWWRGKCGHEWQAKVGKMCNGTSRCPICYRMNRSRNVICIENGEVYSIKQALQFANVKDSKSIYRCCRGEQKTSGGYHWKYS